MMHAYNYTGGRQQSIRALIKAGTHRVEAWGNSREGFEAYLCGIDPDGTSASGCSISDRYRRLCDLRSDANDTFGPVTVRIGRNW